ncbi:MAG: hypothetical protein WDM76_03365 [Limisphaerales bacterium]
MSVRIFHQRNPPLNLSKRTDAAAWRSGFNAVMYCTDFVTGETLFQFPAPRPARSVVLEAFANHKRLRVRMQRCASDWIARLELPSGWYIYRFEVDGKAEWDRAAGKMKTQDGRPCSLAMISSNPKSANGKAARLNVEGIVNHADRGTGGRQGASLRAPHLTRP